MPKFNDAGLALIKEFEGCQLEAYKCPAGVWTQGYGHTEGITEDSPIITQDQADAWLQEDILKFQDIVLHWLDVAMNDNQFSATVCFVYNEGTAPLHGHFGTYLNDARYADAANEFSKWVYANVGGVKKILDGLVKRRNAERLLFLTPVA